MNPWDSRKNAASWWYDFDRRGVAVGWSPLLNFALRDFISSSGTGRGWTPREKMGFSPWGVGNAIGNTTCTPKFILPRLSWLRLFHQIGKRGFLANSLSPTQERRDMNYLLSQGFFQLISPYCGVSLSPRTRCQRLPWWRSSPLIRNLEKRRLVQLPATCHSI